MLRIVTDTRRVSPGFRLPAMDWPTNREAFVVAAAFAGDTRSNCRNQRGRCGDGDSAVFSLVWMVAVGLTVSAAVTGAAAISSSQAPAGQLVNSLVVYGCMRSWLAPCLVFATPRDMGGYLRIF